ncbi:MAG TPA: thioredoxin family protein [Patescibacteria group bacterium]|nr:thioredoxin family protein [Patescibacteria group bacterium]
MNNQITSIQVLGSGCPTCKKLHELTKEAAKELNITTEVEYSSDIQKLLDTGMMSSPVLVINGKAVLAGSLPSIAKIKELLGTNNEQPEIEEKGSCCSCGGKC